MRRIVLLAFIIIVSSIFFIPPSEGDIALVPGVVINENTILINITVEGEDIFIDIANNFTLISYLDDIFYSTVSMENGSLINADIMEPMNATIEIEESEFTIKYTTYNDTTDEMSFLYYYQIHYQNTNGINFSRYIQSSSFYKLWTEYFAYIQESQIIINSNVYLTTFNGSEYKNGTEIEFYYVDPNPYYFSGLVYFVEINWSDGDQINDVAELINCNITEEHVSAIPDLITKEQVDINITMINNEVTYQLKGEFVLNKSIISSYNPVSLWFPENGTNAKANLSYDYTDYSGENKSNSIDCYIERSVRYGQKGFYITIPELEEEWMPLINDPTLNVSINGTLENNWFDFVIVTIPREDSRITVSYPSLFEITKVSSPFENCIFNNLSDISHITFSGECLRLDKVHIEWNFLTDKDGDSIPDNMDAFPYDPTQWSDTDGDGYGDNPLGNNPDKFPDDPTEWVDTDDDGIGDNSDVFPDDPTEWVDTDDDGIGDNSDVFPNDPTEWVDTDDDGIGDNSDIFPNDPTEWVDTDNDGLGDNFEDPYLDDHDNDGHPDLEDDYPNNPEKWKKESSKDDIGYLWLYIVNAILIVIIIFEVLYLIKIKTRK